MHINTLCAVVDPQILEFSGVGCKQFNVFCIEAFSKRQLVQQFNETYKHEHAVSWFPFFPCNVLEHSRERAYICFGNSWGVGGKDH